MRIRPRRNRQSAFVRDLVREHQVNAEDLVLPCFLVPGEGRRIPVKSMPGIERLSLDLLLTELRELVPLGLRAIAPFPAIDDAKKDAFARESLNPDNLYLHAIRAIKKEFPELVIFADVAMDPYSSDGHDGLVRDGQILNDETLPILAAMAVEMARAGADFVAPSDMMDGRVATIRDALDAAGFTQTGIMSYCAKYASAFYGPFRDALDSAPRSGDKKTYQMDPANRREARRELALDLAEGADMVMVKPGLPYLDVVADLAAHSDVPVTVYNVSGEYAMVKAAAANGWIDEKRVIAESLLAFKRAGASLIFSYHTAEWLRGK
ncbi:MAG: delta-aminolevulinic acid dehydratase HemB [Verrucomicrobiota bacterium]|jgi:porphobilinogen synthase